MTSYSAFKPSPQRFEMRIVRGTTRAKVKKQLSELKKEGWIAGGEIKRAAPCEAPNANGEYYCMVARPKA